jgi:hypothetical protein
MPRDAFVETAEMRHLSCNFMLRYPYVGAHRMRNPGIEARRCQASYGMHNVLDLLHTIRLVKNYEVPHRTDAIDEK